MTETVRDQAIELLTGVDDEVAQQIIAERVAAGNVFAHVHAELTGAVRTYAPERSIARSLERLRPQLLTELRKSPGAADGIQKVIVSLWQFGFRSQRAVENVGIRDARISLKTDRGPELRFTLYASGGDVPRDPVPTGVLGEIVERRNAQLADILERAPGALDAALAVLNAVRQMAVRKGWPHNQTGIRDGSFLPTPAGGELRFEFYRSMPERQRPHR